LKPLGRLFVSNRLLRALFAPSVGGMFELAEFEDALKKVKMEIVNLKHFDRILILRVSRKKGER